MLSKFNDDIMIVTDLINEGTVLFSLVSFDIWLHVEKKQRCYNHIESIQLKTLPVQNWLHVYYTYKFRHTNTIKWFDTYTLSAQLKDKWCYKN